MGQERGGKKTGGRVRMNGDGCVYLCVIMQRTASFFSLLCPSCGTGLSISFTLPWSDMKEDRARKR